MSTATSPGMGRLYGAKRVCEAFGVPRSSFYDCKARRNIARMPLKRGPKTSISDKTLLALIRRDLAAAPFIGVNHRKVWSRLRFGQGIKVGRKRVLRIMRECNMLSPHRIFKGPPREYTGRIITFVPDITWGTDGTRVFTLGDGWCRLFTTVEHWNVECIGWHVAKTGDRFAALQPLSMPIRERFGSVGAEAAVTGNAKMYQLLRSNVVGLSREGGTAHDIDGGFYGHFCASSLRVKDARHHPPARTIPRNRYRCQ